MARSPDDDSNDSETDVSSSSSSPLPFLLPSSLLVEVESKLILPLEESVKSHMGGIPPITPILDIPSSSPLNSPSVWFRRLPPLLPLPPPVAILADAASASSRNRICSNCLPSADNVEDVVVEVFEDDVLLLE